jgi:hypothetical protein
MAELALEGVGDARLGEWREVGAKAVHLRRRLSAEEQGDMQVRDIRGTDEEAARLGTLLREAPHLRPYLPQIGGGS